MRITKEQSDANRRTILDTAERMFRDRGIDGVGLADLMKAAGFTHGGFYNHFASKDALVVAACDDAMTRANALFLAQVASGDRGAFVAYANGYLTPAHRDHPDTGCTFAALAGDVAHQGEAVQDCFATSLHAIVDALAGHLTTLSGEPRAAARVRAIELWSAMIGALVVARSIAGADPKLSDEVLAIHRRAIARRVKSGS